MSRNAFLPVLFVNFFVQAFIAVFFLFPAALQGQGFPLSQIGWLMSSFSMVSTVVRLMGGAVSEKVGVRKTLLVSSLLLIITSLPLAWTSTFPWILLLRIIMGIFFSVAMVSVSSYQAMIIPLEKRGSAYAWIGAAYALPQLTVFPLGDLFLSGGGYVPYVLLAPLMAFFCLACSFMLPSTGEQKSTSRRNGRETPSWGKWG
ncbi:MAG: MFS transporter, partial [Synergistales bacterium]|nr:MFS transporter [Synergistales bacterium]